MYFLSFNKSKRKLILLQSDDQILFHSSLKIHLHFTSLFHFGKMFSSQIKHILNFFDICGFNTCITNLSNGQKSSYIMNFVHISMLILFIVIKFYFIYIFFSLVGTAETINEYVQYSSSLLAYWLIISDSIHYRQKQKHFWEIIQKNEKYFCQNLNFQSYIVKFYEFFTAKIFAIIVATSLKSFAVFGIMGLPGYIAYITPVEICQIRLFYYIFCLEIIYFYLKFIESDLILVEQNMKFYQNSHEIFSLQSFAFHRLKWIRQYFHDVYEMINLLNKIFGCSQVASVLFCYYSLFTDLNYCYIHFNNLTILDISGMYFNYF